MTKTCFSEAVYDCGRLYSSPCCFQSDNSLEQSWFKALESFPAVHVCYKPLEENYSVEQLQIIYDAHITGLELGCDIGGKEYQFGSFRFLTGGWALQLSTALPPLRAIVLSKSCNQDVKRVEVIQALLFAS